MHGTRQISPSNLQRGSDDGTKQACVPKVRIIYNSYTITPPLANMRSVLSSGALALAVMASLSNLLVSAVPSGLPPLANMRSVLSSGTLALVVMASLSNLLVSAVPSGFTDRTIFEAPRINDIVFTSDDKMFVIQKMGFVAVREPGVDYQYTAEPTIVLDIEKTTCAENERGLGGLALHPDFDSNNWIYLYYTYPKGGNCDEGNDDDGPVNRLSRWTYNPMLNEIDPESEVVLLDTPSAIEAMHNSGKLEFGNDGMLYVSIGDQGVRSNAQKLDNVLGGMIRITDQGDIPPDNPFAGDGDGVRCNETGSGDGKCQELYAVGLRNPFRFSMNPNTPRVQFFVNDVGASTWEEISEGGDDFEDMTVFDFELGLQNFGWPVYEGPCDRGEKSGCDEVHEGYIRPIHYYQHQGGGAAVGSAFVPNGIWGGQYDNRYFFSDYILDKVYTFSVDEECTDCDTKRDPELFTDFERVVAFRFGPYIGGQTALYYSSHADGGVMRQVICDGIDCGSAAAAAPTTFAPTTAPTPYVPPVRPDGEGGYPGVLFPWNSGSNCPEGYDFCGVLEFCMGESSLESGPVYGYRLPCPPGETCDCKSIPGPLIRLKPGNVYKMTLRNAGTEETNLHTHGLHIVGDGDGDDVVRKVGGGGNCLDYTWDIKDDHPAGTNWYHAHLHTLSEKQVGGGAFGMLIVEENAKLDPVLPSWAANEILLQVSVNVYTDDMYANGRQNEVIDVAANQWYRLRVSLVDANAVPHNFTFADDGTCEIHKVATDGIWRSTVPGPMSNHWELTGASRADFAIKCNVPETLVPILYRDEAPIANIWVGPEDANVFTMEEWQPTRPYAISDMREATVPEENKFAVRLGFDYVNDGRWNATDPIATIAFDEVHEWTLQQTWLHPFHMHLYHMQIVQEGGCGDGHEEGEIYDTISAPGDCTIRFRTADIGQRCVLHCHVLFHEDSGSMSWVNVVGTGMPLNTVDSPEYVCPADELPTVAPVAPTSSPTFAPTFANNCVPGYLGIATGQPPLLDNEPFVNADFAVYIIQQGDGNLIVRAGTPTAPGEIIWASGATLDGSDDFFSQVNADSSLVTLEGTPDAPGVQIFSTLNEASAVAKQDGQYFLGIDCNSEIVSVYAGSFENPREAVSVWNHAPTTPPTAYPTRSPTTAPPTKGPEPTAAPEPTVAPTSVSLTLGETSAATSASFWLSVLATLLFVPVVLV